LVEHFVRRFCGLTGKEVQRVADDAMRLLMTYDWPGNVRELEHAIEHAFVLVAGPTITLAHIPTEISKPAGPSKEPVASQRRSALASAERQVIEQALQRHRWNKGAASRELGMSRSTLWRRMRKLGIAVAPSHI
jgi:DNA-binding NtrC family response regulator